jgi:aspartyl-tRNA(Asn)/glutamyl-tRNA(Gln) amidotransferase subunit C
MAVSKDEVRHIALLARLHVEEDEIQTLQRHLNGILVHFGRLKSLDLEGVDPFAREDLEITPWREDTVVPWDGREGALSQAPRREGDYFRVPRILENEDE